MDDSSDRAAPEGTVCHRHPERPALARCPQCRQGACIVCWHDMFDCCDICLRRDPSALAPPVPWEVPDRNGLWRLGATLLSALRPTGTAPAFARADIAPAVRFALLTALPLALLRGIVPYTRLLLFGSGFQISVQGAPPAGAVALDVARAMGISLFVVSAGWVALVLPFVSLARAYGEPIAQVAALRALLYRAWLLALGGLTVSTGAGQGLLFWLAIWSFPPQHGPLLLLGVQLLDTVVPLLLLLFAMRATARFAAGTSPLTSFVVTLVPFILMLVVEGLLFDLITPWLPLPVG